MTELQFTGLRADLPIGFMAACGCLRICERTPMLKGARLKWSSFGGTYTPVLSIPATEEEFLEALLADVKKASERPYLTWSPQIKSASKKEFTEAIDKACENSDMESLEWFTSFGTELCTKEEIMEPTPFDMSVARQRFLADALKLASSLSGPQSDMTDHYREALFGPWLYRDDQHSLGWDPSTMKLGAFTYKAPTSMPNVGVRAAVWLAFESLPLFPCFFRDRLQTRAFKSIGRMLWFYWPIWDSPLSLATVSTLLSWPRVSEDLSAEIGGIESAKDKREKARKRSEFKSRGILAIYRSAQFKPNKYLTSFRLPELLYSRIAEEVTP